PALPGDDRQRLVHRRAGLELLQPDRRPQPGEGAAARPVQRTDAPRPPRERRPALPRGLRDRTQRRRRRGEWRQLHLRPPVADARHRHRRLHRDGARFDAGPAGLAGPRPPAGVRAIADGGIPRAAAGVAAAFHRHDGAGAMSQTARVMTGLVAGIVFGILLAWVDQPLALQVADVVQPFGTLWLNALQMTVVPLVLALVIVGVNQASDAAHSCRVARRAILLFVALLAAAGAMAALLAPLALSLFTPDPGIAVALRGHDAELPATSGGWAQALTAIVPSNAVAAAAAGAMLPLVTFALFFGFALTRIEAAQRTQVVGFFKAVSEAMIVIVRWVLWAAPVGIFALVLSLTARAGLGVLQALGIYVLLECALYVLAVVLLVAVAITVGKRRFGHFMGGLVPVQAVAASTQSSLATLPAMLDSAQNRLGIPARVSGLVLPMAVSLFRITSPIQYIA